MLCLFPLYILLKQTGTFGPQKAQERFMGQGCTMHIYYEGMEKTQA